jgi:Zn-dependent protease
LRESPKSNNNRQRMWLLGAIALFVISKGKTILTLLKVSKFTAPIVSMFVTIGAYAIIFPVQFAVGLVLMLLIHEIGHVIAAKHKGLPVSAPLFIPFLGALITMKKHPRDAVTEAYIAFGGPILGTVGAIAAYVLAIYTQYELLYLIAYVGFFLNAINLLPIHPLDGGRISTAVTRWLWLVGLLGGLVVIVYMKSILFFVIWALFAWELLQKYVLKNGNRKKRLVPFTLPVALEPLIQMGAFIPGEDHQRELQFSTSSTLQGEQEVTIHWPGLAIEQSIPIGAGMQLIIHKVSVTGVRREPAQQPERLVIQGEIQAQPYEPDDYYDVPLRTRWVYGMLYAGLAVFLVSMLYTISGQVPEL